MSNRNPGKKALWKKSLLEKMAVERSGKKAWWKESLVCFGEDGKKPGVFCLGLIHIKSKGEAKLTYYFNQLPFRPFDLKMFSGT